MTVELPAIDMGRASTTKGDIVENRSPRGAEGLEPHAMGVSALHRLRRRQGDGVAATVALLLGAVATQLFLPHEALGQQPAPAGTTSAAQAGDVKRIPIVLARGTRDLPPPLSLLDFPPQDDGVAGAQLAINDNNTTGRFLKQEFALDVVQSASAPELIAEVVKRVSAGAGFVIVDAAPETVLAIADALKGRDALVMNAGSGDDRLREADCRANLMHTAPSRAMLADGLAQYLVWKQWRRWFLVRGEGSDDEAFA